MLTAIVKANIRQTTGKLERKAMRNAFRLLAGLAMGWLAANACATSLDGIRYTALPGDRVQLELKLSDPAATDPLSFTIDNPARVALDFTGVKLNVAQKSQSVGVGKVESVTAVEAGGRTRVVVNLVQLVPYAINRSGDVIKVVLEGVPADLAPPTGPKAQTIATPAKPAAAAGARAAAR
jgi:type IV pilus assembly protein PilQ